MPTRLIREGWLESEAINQLDPLSERFFLRLCLRADDYGRFHANPILLKSALFPLREDVRGADISRWLAACEKSGMVRCYSDSGKPYLEIPKFGQRTRADKSKFPEPPDSVNVPLLPGMSLSEGIGPRRNAGHMPGNCQARDRHPQPYAESKTKNKQAPPAAPDVASESPPLADSRTAVPSTGVDALLFAAIVTAEGSRINELSQKAVDRITSALREIIQASANVTPAEIAERARRYPLVMPKGCKITAHALAKHWAKCSPQGALAPVLAMAPEPEAWRQFLKDKYEGESWAESAAAYSWETMPEGMRSKIAREIISKKRATA